MRRLSISLSSVLGWMCRLSGLATAMLLVPICLSRGLLSPAPLAVLQVGAALLLAALIGAVVQECAFALIESLVTACGRPFFRKSTTVTGRLVSEVWLPGGRWVRCETWRTGATLAWTERDGSCTGIEMPAMTVAQAWPSGYSRDQLQGRMQAAAVSASRLQAEAFREAARTQLPAAPATAARRHAPNGHGRHLFEHLPYGD